jgi:hypothetical protein
VIRIKTFDATGIAPNGRLFATDLNAIQDAAAGLTDLTQHLSVADIAIGESGLILSRFGAGIARLSGSLRLDTDVNAVGRVFSKFGLASQVAVGDLGPAAQAGIAFGSALDTDLYRSAAATLKTDGAFIVVGALTAGSIGPLSALAGYPADATKYLRGDGTWATITIPTQPTVVTGIVSSAGGVTAGTGYSVVRNGTGSYTVTYTSAFAATPTVVIAPVGNGGFWNITAQSPSSFTVVWTNTGGGVNMDTSFNFIARQTT